MGTVAIIGDVGGHAQQLMRCLKALGASGPGDLPDDMTVVQVGDLLGGVDDVEAVEIVSGMLPTGRWVQLLGNWDSRVVGGRVFSSPTRGQPDPDAEDLFALWHHYGFAHHAAAVRTAAGATAVVTHAGVTQPFWRRWLGVTLDPLEAVARINDLPLAVVHQPGRMLGVDDAAAVGPIWADTGELWSSWLDTQARGRRSTATRAPGSATTGRRTHRPTRSRTRPVTGSVATPATSPAEAAARR